MYSISRGGRFVFVAESAPNPGVPASLIVQTFNRNGGNPVGLGFSLVAAC